MPSPTVDTTGAPDTTGSVFLEARNVSKTFGGSKALDNVGIALRRGEVHALVGANGAGKSTLARIIAGHLRPDAAEILLDGRAVDIASPREAINQGVAMVTQQLSLAADLSVAENIMLTEMAKPGRLNRRRLFEKAEETLLAVNPAGGIDLSAETGRLSAAHRQMVEIAKAMSQAPQVVIFDEPTTSLTPFETERLFEVMDNLTRQGKALAFVSHRMEEIFTICNTVTVLRDGRNVCASVPLGELSQGRMIQLIIGRDIGADIFGGGRGDAENGAAAETGERPTVLEVRHLASPPRVHDVSFSLKKGEILGLAGLVGAGRTETVRALFGLDKVASGEVLVNGLPYTGNSPRKSHRLRMAMIPEDRKTQGAIPDFTVRENIMLGHSATFSRVGTGYSRLMPMVLDIIKELRLDSVNLRKFIFELSGGMQQKAMISRALLVDPEILILDEPTQGVDVGTRSDIYAILRRLAARGISILLVSSDFEEILGISDRIVVLTEGRSVAEFDAAVMDEEKLTMFAAPRTSAQSTRDLIRALVARWPQGTGYWTYFGHGRVYCFERVDGAAALPLGFGAGDVAERGATCLASATVDEEGVVAGGGRTVCDERDGLVSFLAPRHNSRGQRLGYIGLTLGEKDAGAVAPDEFAALVHDWAQ